MASTPNMITVSPEGTGTTPEQRWEVLRDYRWYRQRGNDSASALAAVRRSLRSAERSASNYAARLRASDRPGRAVRHQDVADYYRASVRYLALCLQPRVDAWNAPRESDALEALSRSLGGVPTAVDPDLGPPGQAYLLGPDGMRNSFTFRA